jgi:hypothetical protein
MLTAINKGYCESGLERKNKEPISLTKSPIIIRNTMLNPTEKRTVSTTLSLSTFNSLTITKPGIKVKYAKPKIWRATGMLKRTVKYNAICSSSSITRKVLELSLVAVDIISKPLKFVYLAFYEQSTLAHILIQKS